ncbi:hypothetical protein BD410DRAFT_842973 [Rickenella mellea]|uniref:Uncharacterized protein n=1 Tax=Rickenella mellea TaxID=50990 RepID=A0A4Y7PT67_9AGAM|nr:hypothetical protein BD410DRAFT_842973 [Rickenella mellea]
MQRIRASTESMRSNWRSEPELGVFTSGSGGSGRFNRQHDIGDDDGGTARNVLGVLFNECLVTFPVQTAHGITHPSTPCWPLQATARSSLGSFYAEKRVWPSLECLDLAVGYRFIGRSQLCIRALRRFYGDLFDGYSLIPTLSFDEDIHSHLIPHPYDTPSTRSMSPDDVALRSFSPPRLPPRPSHPPHLVSVCAPRPNNASLDNPAKEDRLDALRSGPGDMVDEG